MKTKNLVSGTAEWHEHRAKHFNASDAPAMLGCSTYRSRSDLLRAAATGVTDDVDPATQRRFDDGHLFEGWARPLAEQIIDELLSPVTGYEDDLSASFDGINFDRTITWEHKTLNNKLRQVMTGEYSGADLPKEYRVQMEQGFIISGASRCLFMASVWDKDSGNLLEERHCWYESDQNLQREIVSGWQQFAIDLENYQHDPGSSAVVVTGKAPESLPALHIEVTGMVTASNLNEFKSQALAVIGGINKDLQSDEDFADAEKTVKWLGEVESRLESAKEHALSQTASIDQLFKAVDDIKENARRTRLDLNKLVTARKEARRNEIRQAGVDAYRTHIDSLNARLGRVRLPDVPADFAGVMKGKKTIASLSDAVSVELARVKIASNELADKMEANIKIIDEQKYPFLFADIQQLAAKDTDDLKELIAARVANHEAEEKRKEEEQRQKIRLEEEAKARTAAGEFVDHVATQPQENQATASDKPRVRQHSTPTKTRPTDQEIIGTLSLAYRVHESKVIEWLLDMDLSNAEEKLAANF